ncbi:MAG: four helix bundle protein [Ignavibacteriales bacterium]|nr:four helix bundle protein [Ignavibacteriales bacterium]
MDEGLGNRLFDFAVRIIKFCRALPRGKEYEIIKYQLIKSSTSSGANYSPRQI